MTERRTPQLLTPEQRSRLHSPQARGIALDRLGRMASMREFDDVAEREHRQPIIVVEIGGGLPLHGVAMQEYWLQVCRGTAQDAVKAFSYILQKDQILHANGRVSDFFVDPSIRDRFIENFSNTQKSANKMLVAALTEVLANPPELPTGNSSGKRGNHLTRELHTRFYTDQAFEHLIVEDIPEDEDGLGQETIITAKMYGGKGFRDIVHDVMGQDPKVTEYTLQALAIYFGPALASPRTIKPFRVISMDTRDPEELAHLADALYPDWFKETQRYKRAKEFNGFTRQRNPWDLEGLEDEQVSHMVVKNPEPEFEDEANFEGFKNDAPLVIARNGFVAIVPAFVQYDRETMSDGGYGHLTSEWMDDKGFEMGMKSYAVQDLKVAGVNSYERQLFEEGPYGTGDSTKSPQRLYVVTFSKPRRTLAERVAALETT